MTERTDIHTLNLELCAALGVDVENVFRVTLVVQAEEVPLLTVERHVFTAGTLASVMARHKLAPLPKAEA